MSFDWSEFLNLAAELCGVPGQPPNREAKARAAISRAYYAAFCTARNYLRDNEGLSIPAGAAAHTYVRNALSVSPDRVRRSVEANLNRLRNDRNRADYDDRVAGLTPLSARAVLLARQVIADVPTL